MNIVLVKLILMALLIMFVGIHILQFQFMIFIQFPGTLGWFQENFFFLLLRLFLVIIVFILCLLCAVLMARLRSLVCYILKRIIVIQRSVRSLIIPLGLRLRLNFMLNLLIIFLTVCWNVRVQ